MKEYLKMKDVFDCKVESDADLMYSDSLGNIADFSGYKTQCKYAAHAINSHDELVRKLDIAESTIYEVERVLSEMQRNGVFGLDDVIAEVECCIKRLPQ